MFKWEKGRQGTGYFKLKLFESKVFKFDVYLLKFPVGCEVPWHLDPTIPGYAHYRRNFTLNPQLDGGEVLVMDNIGHYHYPGSNKFRPDVQKHKMTKVMFKPMYMLSIGWLSKIST